jgi:hypothetical protein
MVERLNGWKAAEDWYNEQEIINHLKRRKEKPSAFEPHDRIPEDIYSEDFGKWLCNQYRLAMNKGIEMAQRQPMPSVCPCQILPAEKCRESCSCANPVLSGGCDRCCAYGSGLQQLTAARRAIELEEILKYVQSRCPHNRSKDGVLGETCQDCGFVLYHHVDDGTAGQ